MIPEEKLTSLVKRHQELTNILGKPDALSREEFVKSSKEYSELEPVVARVKELQALQQEMADLTEMMEDEVADADMKALAEEELKAAQPKLKQLDKILSVLLLPKDVADEKSAILEIRAGTGGNEAALFAGDLLRMYQRYAESQGWKFEIISASAGEVGGFKEAIISVNGKGVFAKLKFESGVHGNDRWACHAWHGLGRGD